MGAEADDPKGVAATDADLDTEAEATSLTLEGLETLTAVGADAGVVVVELDGCDGVDEDDAA